MLKKRVLKNLHPLKAFRLDGGFTQDEVAEELGVSGALICRMEKGNRYITPKMAMLIEKRIGIPRHILRPDLWHSGAR